MRGEAGAARDCPVAEPGHASVQARTLHRACLIVGGKDVLAAQLDVPLRELEHWLLGEGPIPEAAFLQAVDIVLLHVASVHRSSS